MKINATNDFSKWAKGYSGCQGNVNSSLWFCGIEYGGNEDENAFHFTDVSKPSDLSDEEREEFLSYASHYSICWKSALFNLRLLICLFVAISVSACTGSTKYMKAAEGFLNPGEGKALVRFLRPYKYTGGGRVFAILDGEKAIGIIPNRTQFDYLADPGKHLFISTAAGFDEYYLEAELEAAKIYYVIASQYSGWTVVRANLIPVNRNSEFWDKVKDYETSLERLKPDTKLLRSWEGPKRNEIRRMISDYETKLKEDHQWLKLNKEDGR